MSGPHRFRFGVQLTSRQAGPRIDEIEFSALVWYLQAGRTPRSAAQAAATTADMVAKLRDYRDTFGITYWVVGPDDIEPMKCVIEALAGS